MSFLLPCGSMLHPDAGRTRTHDDQAVHQLWSDRLILASASILDYRKDVPTYCATTIARGCLFKWKLFVTLETKSRDWRRGCLAYPPTIVMPSSLYVSNECTLRNLRGITVIFGCDRWIPVTPTG